MFRHPKYYKELRKLRNKSEQAISPKKLSHSEERSPDPGHKQGSSNKQQADKAQATKSQAAGGKAQAPSSEGQASSHKHRDPL
jgi:hypothetical protein